MTLPPLLLLLLQGSVPLHWPLVNAPGRMVEQLGKQEFEQKRKEDALEYKKKQPGYRSVGLESFSVFAGWQQRQGQGGCWYLL